MAEQNKMLTNSAMTSVITPIGIILDEFLTYLESWDKDLAYVYDENLSYETAIAKWRMDNKITSTTTQELPLFIFRRSVLRAENEKGIGERSRLFNLVDKQTNKQFQSYFGAFDIDFLYVTRSMIDLERFELTYLMQSGLSNKKTLNVELDQLGERDYNMEFGVLDEKTINIENSYYKVLSGTFTIRGLFFSFSKEAKLIRQIKAKIRDFVVETGTPTETLGQITVTEEKKIILE